MGQGEWETTGISPHGHRLGDPWHDDMRDVARQAHEAGIQFGVIYKGDPSDLSDESFTSDALRHADEVEAVLQGIPDNVILQSWENYPRRALPDTDSSTMTGLVRAYVRPHTRLVLESTNHVRLVRDDNNGVERANIFVEIHDPAPEQTLQRQVMEGTVPHTAVSALFGLRIHAECDCPQRPTHLSLVGYDFRQRNAGGDFHGDLRAWSSQATPEIRAVTLGRVRVLRVEVGAGRQLILNGPTFPVIADQPFMLNFLSQVAPESNGTGFVALIFIGPDGKEIRRVYQLLQTTWRAVVTLHTAQDGSANLPPLPYVAEASVRLRFAGDLIDRPTVLSLKRLSGLLH